MSLRHELQAVALLGYVVLLAASVTACYARHRVTVPIIVVPLVTWTIPLALDDDARLCVETALGAWVDPADARPLRCVDIGTIRAWIRAQRMANE